MMKPVVLIFVGHYLPGYRMGGPLRSIVNLVDRLRDDFEFRIVTSDRDLGDTQAFADVPTNRWTKVGSMQVHYTSPSAQTVLGMAKLIRETPHDLLYLNSFFAPRFTIFPLLARRLGLVARGPLVVAPRGEFSAGALALKSLKKRLYIAAGKAMGLFSGVVWQASSVHEAADIRSVLGEKVDVRVATDLAAPVNLGDKGHVARASTHLRVALVGRISPMKNLDYALRVLGLVTKPVSFSIFGPAEDAAYHEECLRLAERLPPHVEVRWHGAAEPAAVPAIMAAHDLFFLPTRGENFGHVIAEALGAGTPVLLSDTTPWRGLEEAGVGWDLPLAEPSAFAAAIDAAAGQDREAAARQRERVVRFAALRQAESGDVEANRDLFRHALAARPQSTMQTDHGIS